MSVSLVVKVRFTYRYTPTGRFDFLRESPPWKCVPLNAGRVSDANSYDGTIPLGA